MSAGTGIAPSLADIDALARAALAALPAAVQGHCGDLVLTVVDWPTAEMLDALEIEDDYALTGLYEGAGIDGGDAAGSGAMPDRVWLFRRPLLDEWVDRGNVTLDELVRHVLVHEIAHHVGLDDDAIAAIDDWTA